MYFTLITRTLFSDIRFHWGLKDGIAQAGVYVGTTLAMTG